MNVYLNSSKKYILLLFLYLDIHEDKYSTVFLNLIILKVRRLKIIKYIFFKCKTAKKYEQPVVHCLMKLRIMLM